MELFLAEETNSKIKKLSYGYGLPKNKKLMKIFKNTMILWKNNLRQEIFSKILSDYQNKFNKQKPVTFLIMWKFGNLVQKGLALKLVAHNFMNRVSLPNKSNILANNEWMSGKIGTPKIILTIKFLDFTLLKTDL